MIEEHKAKVEKQEQRKILRINKRIILNKNLDKIMVRPVLPDAIMP